ncbi:MAG: type IV pilus secretin PilQ [SAR92 clade bacterium]|uniref:Type IV pilus secretin PilQ n=1 Tax=SAR92 clade bacterium TaxID=2315479 RepID=A0A520MNZ6_9GAMM|nr:MAG: type IV pilus secretin PilQ [SAR92 clade bacterium]
MNGNVSQFRVILNFRLFAITLVCMVVMIATKVESEELSITNVEFDLNSEGQALVTISSNQLVSGAAVSVIDNQIKVVFKKTSLPGNLDKRLDVSDFSTPIRYIDSEQKDGNAIVQIVNRRLFTYKTERTDNQIIITVLDSRFSSSPKEPKKSTFKGDLIDLNFQDIQIRDVLQIVADFKSLNLVATDSVKGAISLNLKKVPWDQALDTILKSKGLGMRKQGNILLIAPLEELSDREAREIEDQKQLQALASLETYIARVKYADVYNISKFFGISSDTTSGRIDDDGTNGEGASTLMSDRGSVIIDERTNTIILTDTSEKIDAFKRMLNQIDIPVKQVLIEARIVRASSDFRRELGVSWGVVGNDAVNFNAISDPNQRLTGVLASDLGIENSPTALSLGYLSNNLLIDLELNALEAGGFGEIVSQPKILTADKTQASIKSGVEIPYQVVTTSSNTADGVVQTQFKEAVLKLQVTPQITPDNRVIMDILVKQDSVGSFTVNAEPAIDITEITTQALVGNGQTLVLGGIFQSEELSDIEEVPILGDIPLLGNLFKKQMRAKDKREILIFITPKIIDENFIDT